jgi:predicted RNase H-like nuclease
VTAVGVDACKGGWVAVVLREAQPPTAHLLASIDRLDAAVPDAEVVAIDIPIGLLDDRVRAADMEARRLLGGRRNSLFMTPVRRALEADDHAAGSAISVAVTGSGISRQAHGLRSRTFEVRAWAGRAPCRVVEAHPELCFTEMNGGRPPSATKKSWHGMVERRAALAAAGIELDAVDPAVGGLVPIDDVLDAAAAAWTAWRVVAGTARVVPDPPELDASGFETAIWF